mmetsp:Transcript_9392/g.10922  ORF Transcript_9392/g.10922 Transcript_9392/m.10922 type:complete len:111 (-) Transcript_9392:1032-1364(-)
MRNGLNNAPTRETAFAAACPVVLTSVERISAVLTQDTQLPIISKIRAAKAKAIKTILLASFAADKYREHTDTPAMAYATTCRGIRPTVSTENIAKVVPNNSAELLTKIAP